MGLWGRAALLAVVLMGAVTAPAVADTGPGDLEGRVWFDRDGNNIENQGEPGRAGAKVVLHQVSPPADYVAYTDQDGHYAFTGLALGDYTVHAIDDGYRTSGWNTQDRTLALPHPTGYDHFGQQGGRIHGRAWDDTNGDGVRQDTEPRRETQFSLVGPSGFEGLLNRTVTTTGGADYYFEDVPQGTYKLQTTAPPGMTATKYHAGTEWYLDSDFHSGLGSRLSSDPLSIWPGSYLPNNDVGFVVR